jgi:hypothetical protein
MTVGSIQNCVLRISDFGIPEVQLVCNFLSVFLKVLQFSAVFEMA